MMVPSQRLIWFAAAIAIPAATVAGFSPSLAITGGAVLVLCAVFAALDAVWGAAKASEMDLRTPPFLRFTKEAAARFPVIAENRSSGSRQLRIAPSLPAGVDSEMLTQDVALPPGTSQVEWPVICRTRGDLPMAAIHFETASPMGLWLIRETRAVDFRFRVYPNLRDKATGALFLKTAIQGAGMRRQVGKGREFDNLRHYVPGDNFEDIHWKATARRAFPIVKLFRVEHAQEVYAVVDSSRLSAREGILEGYVEAALHLALVAERQGDRFGLVTFSDHTKRFVRARSGLDHFRVCREAIYNLAAERVSPDFRDVFTTLQLNLRRRSLLVFFTSLDDALLAETFEREVSLVARRHLVLVNVTETPGMRPLFTGGPPAKLDDLYDGLAGQMLFNRMRTLQIALQNRGVRLAMVPPERLKERVTAAYLEVKRRQVL
jgi:uncharacterized protein (DUF58 family)